MGKKLYVGNLAYTVDSSTLQQLFEAHGTVVFVEVKFRTSKDRAAPLVAVNWKKREDVARTAAIYLSRRGLIGPSGNAGCAYADPLYGSPPACGTSL